MKLIDWLTKHKLTQADFAKKIGSDQGHVSDLVRGKVKPKLASMDRMIAVTGGEVSYADWSDVKPKAKKRVKLDKILKASKAVLK